MMVAAKTTHESLYLPTNLAATAAASAWAAAVVSMNFGQFGGS